MDKIINFLLDNEYEKTVADVSRNFTHRKGTIGEGFGEGVLICSRGKLYDECRALARYIKARLCGKAPSILLCDGGMYDTATVAVTASLLSCTLTLSRDIPTERIECSVTIAPHPPVWQSDELFISTDELQAIILGELAEEHIRNLERIEAEKNIPVFEWGASLESQGFGACVKDDKSAECDAETSPNATLFELVLLSNPAGKDFERYSEAAVISAAREYRVAEGLFPFDTCFSTLHSCTKEGFFGGILAPMMTSKRIFHASPSPCLFEQMRLSSPTKLLCEPSLAAEIAYSMQRLKETPRAWRKGRGSNPLRLKLDRLFPRTRAAIRRLRLVFIHYPFGGRLSGICTVGDSLSTLPDSTVDTLLGFGIVATSLMSVKNCLLTGFRRASDPADLWRLARGLRADMCDVEKNGVGRLTFGGNLVSDAPTNGHTLTAGELRLEFPEKRLLVTELCGFPSRNGTFFVRKPDFS